MEHCDISLFRDRNHLEIVRILQILLYVIFCEGDYKTK